MRNLIVTILALGLCVGLVAADAPKGKTLDNLQAAYNGESNARAKYEVYAKKAQEEGYLGASALFRAAAEAEGVHAEAHADVIRKMGATPKAEVKAPSPKAVQDMVADALKGETYEMETMYPDFIAVARAEDNGDALQTFTYAIEAEREHAKLYGEALKDLSAWKAPQTFWVCAVCGYTVPKVTFEACPSCKQPKDMYVEVK